MSLLGILYVVLADVAIQGLRSEGISKRRMEASLLADRALSDLEIGIDAGNVPPVGELPESEQDGFRIAVDVSPYILELPPLESGQVADPGAPERGAIESLREISLSVIWDEGGDEYRVVRTTYAADATSTPGGAVGLAPTRTEQPPPVAAAPPEKIWRYGQWWTPEELAGDKR